jgi:pyruvate dehydrogenase E2 component (dihydrolipoamide acetyltransferase)
MPFEFRFPDVGEGIDAGELVQWHVSEGQHVREDDPMADVQTDKATVTIPCPATGRVLELRVRAGEMVSVGEVMAVFETEYSEAGTRAQAPAPASPGVPLASPAVRRRAAELGVDLAEIRGSGPGGRIELVDLDRGDSTDRVVQLRGVRRAIARTMTQAWQTIPHIIDYREADASELLRWRDRLREQAPDEPSRRAITLTPLLLRVAVTALRSHPYLNASIDMERAQITLHGAYHIGIATAAPDGLLVPVIRDADKKSVWELAHELAELSAAARERRLRPEQLKGATFTLNNYGALGVWLGTPIIKPGEVANLGVGRVQERPVAVERRVVVRPVVALAVSGDHRVLDGHTLAAFVTDVVGLIENPPAEL